MTVVHVPASRWHPAPVGDDAEHEGPATSAYAAAWRSADGLLEVGVWEFSGEQCTKPRDGFEDGYEEVTTIVEGSLLVAVGTEEHLLAASDTIVYDCPIGAKRLVSDGWKGIYVVRRRDRDGRDGRVMPIRADRVHLERQATDAGGHSGEITSDLAVTFTSRDEQLQAGLWRLGAGEMDAEPQDGYDEVLVVLEGNLEVALDGAVLRLGTGDALVYVCPIGAKRLRTDGCVIQWLVRYR